MWKYFLYKYPLSAYQNYYTLVQNYLLRTSLDVKCFPIVIAKILTEVIQICFSSTAKLYIYSEYLK